MEVMLWIFICILVLAVLLLSIKIHLMQKAAMEINAQFNEKLTEDTNTLIRISGHDRYMLKLAADINVQLQQLRTQKLQFQLGNTEIADAATNISHDLRTPLTAICGYLDLLKQTPCPEEARRYLTIIEERAEALKQLTEELFRYCAASSAIDEISYEEININGVLEEVISSYYAALKGCKITPSIIMPDKPIIHFLNKHALSRIFGNIISNAVKYSDGDFNISLSEKGEILFSNHASRLNELHAMQLFNRYYTVESAENSTGFGLSIAKELTEKMNGEITASWKDGIFCIFIYFPGQ